MKVLGLKQLLSKNYRLLELSEGFKESLGELEEVFVMIVWGQSGQGKSNFLMQFVKELCKHGLVMYVGLEEGHTKTMQNLILRHLSNDENGRVRFADHGTTLEKLIAYLRKKKSPKYVIIDSLQYLNITYDDYKKLKEMFPKKSFIFISHAKGKTPDGKTADKIRYDAGLKIRVEGCMAFILSRYGGTKNYVINEERAKRYWGKQFKKHLNR